MTLVITFHRSGYRDFKTYYIHFVYCSPINEFPELCSYARMLKLMQGVFWFRFAFTSLTVRQGRQGLPSLICLSYRFITTYAFSDIRFLKVQRSEEKERWGGSTV
ncbi:hypothetical protein [Candidatus Enterovibrio escicola]|nr:hypothetical protein [Candidatus Enterovibrio escacola]